MTFSKSFQVYCDLCERHKTTKQNYNCKICYKSYCENCYFEEVYENDDICDCCLNYEINCEFHDDNEDIYEKIYDLNIIENNLKSLNDDLDFVNKSFVPIKNKTAKDKNVLKSNIKKSINEACFTNLKIKVDNPEFCNLDISVME